MKCEKVSQGGEKDTCIYLQHSGFMYPNIHNANIHYYYFNSYKIAPWLDVFFCKYFIIKYIFI